MVKKKLGIVYDSIKYWIIQRALPLETISRDKVMRVIGEIFHVRCEDRKKVLHELVDYGYIEIISSNEYKIVGA